MPQPEPKSWLPRTLELALLFTGLCWVAAATITADHAAEGLASRLHVPLAAPLIAAVCLLFLLLCGFAALNWIGKRSGSIREANALPARTTIREEWTLGAAIGWGALLITLLLPMLTGALHPQFWWKPVAWEASALAVLTFLVSALAAEVAFRGYLLRRAMAALGTVGGTALLACVYGLLAATRPNATGLSVLAAFLAGIVLSLAYQRTHALWLGWGMHFGWSASMAVLFGLPVTGVVLYNGVVDTASYGRAWLSGGAYGPEGSIFALLAILLAVPVLYRETRDFAWNYTHPAIIPGGFPMDVKPPAAHTAMEQATPPAALVQILGATPTGVSASPHSAPPGSGSGTSGE